MKKLLKRGIASILVALMLFSSAPLTGLVGFTQIIASAYSSQYKTIDNVSYTYHTSDDGKSIIITGMGNKSDKSEPLDIIIPEKIDNLPVIELNGNEMIIKTYFSNVRSITFPETLQNIQGNCVYGLNNLTEVNFNAINCTINKANGLNHEFLRKCPKLTTIKFGSKVEKIPDYFIKFDPSYSSTEPTYIRTIEIPDNVKEIGKYAFCTCQRLETVKIGKGVSKIGSRAFLECPVLESITVDEDNQYYCSDEYGVLYNEEMTVLYKYPSALELETYRIATTTEKIDAYAFSGNNYLVSIKIPDNVTNVYGYAFSKCANLQTVQCGDSLTNIDEKAFYYCANLKNLYFCKDIQYYGNICEYLYSSTGGTMGKIVNLYYEGTQSSWESKFETTGHDNINAQNYHFNWIPTYNIYYDANGGTNAPDPTVKTKNVSVYLTSKTPVQKIPVTLWYLNGNSAEEKTLSNSFNSWNTRPDGNGKTYAKGGIYKDNGDVVLYAQWDYADISDCIEDPSRSGYNFVGWYTKEIGGERITSTSQITDGMNLYAHWVEKVMYTVNFNANGGSVYPSSISVESGKSAALPTPTRNGYICLGWSTSDSATSASYKCGANYYPSSNTTLYAVWKAVYTVNYNANGGYIYPSYEVVNQGEAVTLPKPEERNGYKFLGWSTSSYASNPSYSYGANYYPSSNVTLYAVWKAVYTVTYDANGGSTSKSYDKVERGNGVYLPNATQTGYTFLGWNTYSYASSAEYRASEYYTPMSNTTLYAIWKINNYTVKFNANGGSVSTSSISRDYNNTLTLPTPSRSGYTCLGWSTNSSATSASYSCGASYTVKADTTLYAVWKKEATVRSVEIGTSNLTINYKQRATLDKYIDANYDAEYYVNWYSSNSNVVSVDNNGNVYGGKRGSATVTCEVTDSSGRIVKDSCNVEVKYSFGQWLIVILLFGWIWY